MRCEWFFNDVYAKYRVISITNNTMLETIMKFKLDLHNGCSLPGIREFQCSQHLDSFFMTFCKCPSFSNIFSIRHPSDLNQIQGHCCLFVLKKISIPSCLVYSISSDMIHSLHTLSTPFYS